MEEKEENKSYAVRPQHHHRRIGYSDRDNLFKVRNILNVAFMLLAVTGVVLWYSMDNHTAASIVLITGVVLKIAEVCIRLFHK